MKSTQEKVVIGCGVWLIVLPFLGLPVSWKMILVTATGVVVTYVGALAYKRSLHKSGTVATETRTETFTETS